MRGRFLIQSSVVVAGACAAFFAAAALGDGGPAPGVTQGWDGVLAPGGKVRYVAIPGGRGTAVLKVRARGGRILAFDWLQGRWGIPQVTFGDGAGGGVSADGRTLVLGSASLAVNGLRKKSSFAVYDGKTLKARQIFWLRGDFSFDALSPHGETIFLIQHVSASDLNRYLVRAYDLRTGRLLRHIIADRRSWESTMSGTPVRRVTSRTGRWVYTLYTTGGKPGTKPFVHALDTQRSQAVCIDLPWRGSQNGVWHLRMQLRRAQGKLVLRESRGHRLIVIDTHTQRVLAVRRA